jgi:hypothetical protein
MSCQSHLLRSTTTLEDEHFLGVIDVDWHLCLNFCLILLVVESVDLRLEIRVV